MMLWCEQGFRDDDALGKVVLVVCDLNVVEAQ